MVSLGANDKVGTKIDELTKEFGLTFDGFIAGWHFSITIGIAITLTELNVDNYKIATVFSVLNICFGFFDRKTIGSWLITVCEFAIGFSGGGVIVG